MITHTQWFKLQMFRTFWQLELLKDAKDRFKPKKHAYTIFDRHVRNLHKVMDNIMPKKAKAKPKFEWQGYVNIDVPESKHTELEKFVSDDKTVFFEYNAMLTTDYKITQYFDTYVQGIKTTCTCYNAESSNFGYCLTSYAEDWYTSLAVLVFKHLKYSDRDWHSVASNKIKRFG